MRKLQFRRRLHADQTEGEVPNCLFANSLSIVPEPASGLLFGLAALVLARSRRQRQS